MPLIRSQPKPKRDRGALGRYDAGAADSPSTSPSTSAPRRSSRPKAPRRLEEEEATAAPRGKRKSAADKAKDKDESRKELKRDSSGPSRDSEDCPAPAPVSAPAAPAPKTYVYADFDVPDEIQDWFESFFKLFDNPSADAQDDLVCQLDTPIRFQVGSMRPLRKKRSDICAWLSKHWEAPIISRCHHLDETFICFSYESVMMKGYRTDRMQDGSERKMSVAILLDFYDSGGRGSAPFIIREFTVWETPEEDGDEREV